MIQTVALSSSGALVETNKKQKNKTKKSTLAIFYYLQFTSKNEIVEVEVSQVYHLGPQSGYIKRGIPKSYFSHPITSHQ